MFEPVAEDVIDADVQRALEEDLGAGDLTAALIPESATAVAQVICREPAVLCGQAWFVRVFQCLSTDVVVDFYLEDGQVLSDNAMVCRLFGPARAILSGERAALNFIQTLSGTATLAHAYTQQLQADTKILDTRKTIPGLRLAQKYAVRCGGCHNHRMGLYDAVLIKENHIQAAGSIGQAVSQAKALYPQVSIEVEVESLAEYAQAVQSGADIVLLDNFETEQIRQAVAMRPPTVKLEVSGGVTLATVAALSALGVDYISSGALTKDVRAIDFSMRFIAPG